MDDETDELALSLSNARKPSEWEIFSDPGSVIEGTDYLDQHGDTIPAETPQEHRDSLETIPQSRKASLHLQNIKRNSKYLHLVAGNSRVFGRGNPGPRARFARLRFV